jgi:hypothetical protein
MAPLQVNFMDVARNPKLAKAARAELAGGSAAGASPVFGAGAHSAEVRRAAAACSPAPEHLTLACPPWGPGLPCSLSHAWCMHASGACPREAALQRCARCAGQGLLVQGHIARDGGAGR